jgi:hypothetical protein
MRVLLAFAIVVFMILVNFHVLLAEETATTVDLIVRLLTLVLQFITAR